MSKGQTSAVISIVLSAAIALLAVFGYNVLVVQPQMEALEAQVEGPAGGTTNFGELEASGLAVTAPTAVGTATPGALIDSSGVSKLLEVRDAGTPVFGVLNGGNVQVSAAGDYPVEHALPGREYAFGTISNVTAATVAPTVHALSTVTAYGCQVKNPTVSTGWSCGVNIGASNQLTVTVYEIDATPVPTASVRDVYWWAAGN